MTTKNLFSRPGMNLCTLELFKEYKVGESIYPVLKGISCEIRKGAVTIIQGPSGCGKTTFLNMLGGIDRPDGGEVQIRGRSREMTATDLARYRLHDVGFVFQSFNLIPGLSALDNLQLPMTVTGKKPMERVGRAHALLELVGMHEKASKRPDELSGGEQQRVAIAIALVNDPPLILADEPTGNLDSNNGMIVTDLLCSLAHDYKKSVVICTHDPRVALRGNQVFQMQDGVILTDGAKKAVR